MGGKGSKAKKEKGSPSTAPLLIKVVLMGDSDVGKTSIIRRFTDNEFSGEKPPNASKGMNIRKEITVGKRQVKFEIVDLAFDVEATASDFQNAKACIGVFDYTNPESLQMLETI